jgi:hypothetical protein
MDARTYGILYNFEMDLPKGKILYYKTSETVTESPCLTGVGKYLGQGGIL